MPALDRSRRFSYRNWAVREGQQIVGGTIIGEVNENELMRSHKIMVPPEVFGEVRGDTKPALCCVMPRGRRTPRTVRCAHSRRLSARRRRPFRQ